MNGVYGTVKPARIKPSDVDIYYSYSPSRAIDDLEMSNFRRLDSNYLLNTYIGEGSSTTASEDETEGIILDGLYKLRLPLNIFSDKGIYTIYIKPKEINAVIEEVGVLAAYPDVKGIVIAKPNGISEDDLTWVNGKLVGYRIDYHGENGKEDYTRIITSNNLCEPTAMAVTNVSQYNTRYRFTDSGERKLMFCTVTPSTANNFNPNTLPFIGRSGQKISLVNTKFSPIVIEVEMVDRDIETLSYMLEGDQLRNLDKGILTYFNDDKEIYQQFETFELKDALGNPLYHVKQKKTDITASEDIKSLTE